MQSYLGAGRHENEPLVEVCGKSTLSTGQGEEKGTEAAELERDAVGGAGSTVGGA